MAFDFSSVACSVVIHVAGVFIVYMASTPIFVVYTLPSLQLLNPEIPPLTLLHDVLLLGAMRSLRFVDIVTDVKVANIIWDFSRRQVCSWFGKRSWCQLYRRAAIANFVFIGVDTVVAIVLLRFGHVLNHSNNRMRRCAVCGYFIAVSSTSFSPACVCAMCVQMQQVACTSTMMANLLLSRAAHRQDVVLRAGPSWRCIW